MKQVKEYIKENRIELINERLVIIRNSIHDLGKDSVTIHPADREKFSKLIATISEAVAEIAIINKD